MSLSAYVWGVRLFTFFSVFAWLGIVFTVDPKQAETGGTALFFISLFAVLLGCLTLLVTGTYRRALGDAGTAHHLGSAFRQSFLIATYVEGIAVLQFLHLLYWWNGLLFLSVILLSEFSFRWFFHKRQG